MMSCKGKLRIKSKSILFQNYFFFSLVDNSFIINLSPGCNLILEYYDFDKTSLGRMISFHEQNAKEKMFKFYIFSSLNIDCQRYLIRLILH